MKSVVFQVFCHVLLTLCSRPYFVAAGGFLGKIGTIFGESRLRDVDLWGVGVAKIQDCEHQTAGLVFAEPLVEMVKRNNG